MSELALRKAADKIVSLQSKLEKVTHKGEQAAGRVLSMSLSVGGGVLAGALRSKGYGTIQQLGNTDTDMVLGTLLASVSALNLAGKHSDALGHVAVGFLAAYAARQTEARMSHK